MAYPDWLALVGHGLLSLLMLGVWLEIRLLRRDLRRSGDRS